MESINRYLDAAVLKPDLSPLEAREAIQLCVQHAVRTVCVRPCDIPLAVSLCEGTETEVSTVLAFPHGVTLPAGKAAEARSYISLGVAELDMVVNYGLILGGEWDLLLEDIKAVIAEAVPSGVPVKTIFETCFLSLPQVERATEVAIAAGAAFVKTSTGFATGGATVEAVEAMVRAARGRVRVKASGGIRSVEQAGRFIEIGAERLGVGYTSVEALCSGGELRAGRY